MQNCVGLLINTRNRPQTTMPSRAVAYAGSKTEA